MIRIFVKWNKDGSLSLIIVKEGYDTVIAFDSMRFTLADSKKVNRRGYELFDTGHNLDSLNEIRNEDFDVFYLRMNEEVIFQISWIPRDGELIQQIGFYDKSLTDYISVIRKTVYEDALSRFFDADKYENLSYPYWK